MEEPAFLARLGDLSRARILDLGCGDGAFAPTVLGLGAASYHGIDGSPAMINVARRTVREPRASFDCAIIEDLHVPAGHYDVVTSRMALHYIADLPDAAARIHHALRDGGHLVLSVVHPVISSHDNEVQGPRSSWTVDDYFVRGARRRLWFDKEVTWMHRTVEDYVNAMLATGFRLDTLSECEPDPRLLTNHPRELARRRRVPLMLVLAATR